jgi:cardiolipin synthase
VIGALLTLVYGLGILAAVDAVMTARTAQGAVAWALALVAVPFVAVPAYLVFGRARLPARVAAYADRQHELDAAFESLRDALAPWRVPEGEGPAGLVAVRRLTRMEPVGGNAARLLSDGAETFDDLLAGIADARHTVLAQFYMVHDDRLGRRFRDVLLERARAGVHVQLLYDGIGSLDLPDAWVASLRDGGVQVEAFRPDRGWRDRFQLNFRNHRKLVVVDGRDAWIGGHNVGDEYVDGHPELGPWRDAHLRLTGPAALQAQAVLVADWYWATRRLPPVRWEAERSGDVRAMVVPSAPTQRLETAGLLVVAALDAARERVWLSAPYFVPDEAVTKALQLAALRGVDVCVLLPERADSLAVHLAGEHFVHQLRGLGIRFLRYGGGFLHQKALLVDDAIAAVGTANLDNRSFRLNFEVTALVTDAAFTARLAERFEADFERSTAIDADALAARPWPVRAAVALARLAAPVL